MSTAARAAVTVSCRDGGACAQAPAMKTMPPGRLARDSVEARRQRKMERQAFDMRVMAHVFNVRDVPEWYMDRVFARVLRSYGRAIPRHTSRRRRRSSFSDVQTDWDYADIASRVRAALAVPRLSSNMLARLKEFTRANASRISKRYKRTEGVGIAIDNVSLRREFVARVARAAIARCDYMHDFRGEARVEYAIEVDSYSGTRLDLRMQTRSDFRGTIVLENGQLDLVAKHIVCMPLQWYKVWMRGLAVVDKQMVFDIREREDVGETCVYAAVKQPGFAVRMEWRKLEEVDGRLVLGPRRIVR